MQPTNKILEWITKTKPIIKQCLSHAKQQTKVHSSDIRKFCTISNANKTSTQEKRINKTRVPTKHTQLNLYYQTVCKPMPTSPTHNKHRRRMHTNSKNVRVHKTASKHNQTMHNNTSHTTDTTKHKQMDHTTTHTKPTTTKNKQEKTENTQHV